MDDTFREGVQLFNEQQFFESHEALEGVWLKTLGEEKIFLHGLIQIAAAFHHVMHHNRAGARSLLEKGWRKLEAFGDARRGIDLAALRNQLQPWRDYLAGRKGEESKLWTVAPPLPRIRPTNERPAG